MKRIDFEHGTITGNILGAALPMLVAQLLSLLYNIVDRIYIARIPDVGTTAPSDSVFRSLSSSPPSAIFSAAAAPLFFRSAAAAEIPKKPVRS